VRWLVQSGRISEWETATPPAPEREENRSEAD
jgi:hypothetical protein